MALHFQPKPEIKLRKPPLYEVVCQVKFPPILRITQGIPVDFQDAIRDRFPQYKMEKGILLQFPRSNSTEPEVIEATLKTFRFLTADGKASAALSADFFALSSSKYSHWQEFKTEFNLIHQAVIDLYQPSYATRVGLRFINRFDFENTKTQSVEELLKVFRDQLVCLIQTDAWDVPNDLATQIILSDEDAKLAIRTHYGDEEGKVFFTLDLDFYEEKKIPLNDLNARLKRYHSRIYDAFRWCLKDETLERFEPII